MNKGVQTDVKEMIVTCFKVPITIFP